MRTPWAQPPGIVAFTGAALSRAAGFAPFAADRMPVGLRLEDVVTEEGFARRGSTAELAREALLRGRNQS